MIAIVFIFWIREKYFFSLSKKRKHLRMLLNNISCYSNFFYRNWTDVLESDVFSDSNIWINNFPKNLETGSMLSNFFLYINY